MKLLLGEKHYLLYLGADDFGTLVTTAFDHRFSDEEKGWLDA